MRRKWEKKNLKSEKYFVINIYMTHHKAVHFFLSFIRAFKRHATCDANVAHFKCKSIFVCCHLCFCSAFAWTAVALFNSRAIQNKQQISIVYESQRKMAKQLQVIKINTIKILTFRMLMKTKNRAKRKKTTNSRNNGKWIVKCKTTERTNTHREGREKENFLQFAIDDYCSFVSAKREKNHAAGSTNGTIFFLFIYQMHVQYIHMIRLHRSQLLCVCASIELQGKNGSITIVAAYGNGLNHSKSFDGCGLPLPFVCRVRECFLSCFFFVISVCV